MIIERLFITSADLSAALDPAGRAPVTSIRRLRERGFISHGIELKPHRQGRLRGTRVFYCVLNRDAVESYRDGDEGRASALAKAAGEIEARTAVRELAKALADVDELRLLPPSSQRAALQIARRIARERSRIKAAAPLLGLVVGADAEIATVNTEQETVVMPRETLHARGLDHPGAAVAIRSRQLRTGAMVHSADEAYAVEDDDRGDARPFDPIAMRAERRSKGQGTALAAALRTTRPVRLIAPLALRL